MGTSMLERCDVSNPLYVSTVRPEEVRGDAKKRFGISAGRLWTFSHKGPRVSPRLRAFVFEKISASELLFWDEGIRQKVYRRGLHRYLLNQVGHMNGLPVLNGCASESPKKNTARKRISKTWKPAKLAGGML